MVHWQRRLGELMPYETPPASGTRDWEALERSWGHRFPSDYMWFGDVYGEGGINDFLGVHMPGEWSDDPRSSELVDMTLTARQMWADGDSSETMGNVRNDHPLLVAWAGSEWGDTFCWDAASIETPDRWPVVAFFRDDWKWQQFDCGMVEFLVRAIDDDLSGWEEPMGFKRRVPATFDPR